MREFGFRHLSKGTIFSLALLFHSPISADTPPYTISSIDQHFLSAQHFAVVMRVGGGVTESEYKNMQQRFDVGVAPSTDAVESWPDSVREEGPTKFLVIRNLIGELEPMINVEWDFYETFNFPLGKPVAAFVRPSRSKANVYTISYFEILRATHEAVTTFDGDLGPVIDYFRPLVAPVEVIDANGNRISPEEIQARAREMKRLN